MHKLISFILAGLLALCVALPVQATDLKVDEIRSVTGVYEGITRDQYRIVQIHDGKKRFNIHVDDKMSLPELEGKVGYTVRVDYKVGKLDVEDDSMFFLHKVAIVAGRDDPELCKVQAAAELADSKACNTLGVWYEKGKHGLPKDPQRAVALYLKAVATGDNTLAMHNLGDCYRDGIGVEKNENKAAEWYNDAIQAGNPIGYEDLGNLYLMQGKRDEARAMYQKAAAAGRASAKKKLAEMSDTFCRVVITRDGADVRYGPDGGNEMVFQASKGAEYIASRHTITSIGKDGDGSQWYELFGVIAWEGDGRSEKPKIGQSLTGRSAKGALLGDASLYILAESVREIPLNEGDAEAVRKVFAQNGRESTKGGGKTAGMERLWTSVWNHVGHTPFEAIARHGVGATIRRWCDYHGGSKEPFTEVITETLFATYHGSVPSAYVAAPGTNLAGLVIGQSTENDARKLLGSPKDESKVDGGTWSRKFYKLKPAGSDSAIDTDAEVECVVSVKASRVLYYEEELGELLSNDIEIYIDADGRIAAILAQHYNGAI